MKNILFLVFLFSQSSAYAIPADAQAIIDRKAGCFKEGEPNRKKFKCETFEADMEAIQKKYENQKDIITVIDQISSGN